MITKLKKNGKKIILKRIKACEIIDNTKYKDNKIIINNNDIIVKLFESLYSL